MQLDSCLNYVPDVCTSFLHESKHYIQLQTETQHFAATLSYPVETFKR